MDPNRVEFFVESPTEPSPSSPSFFIDLPPANVDGESPVSHDDMVLPYISRMLMEDDIDDEILRQYFNHPALLEAQQAFAQILSSHSVGANNDNTINNGNTEGSEYLLLDANGDQSTSMPRDNGFIKENPVSKMSKESRNLKGLKKRHNRDDSLSEEVGRANKSMTMIVEPKDIGTHDMFDVMMHGHEIVIRNMEKLRIAMAREAEENSRKGNSKAVRDAVDLCSLLIRCAQAVDANDHMSARELLKQIKQHASATGDATQRLAQCFVKGLEARLVGTGSQLQRLLMAERPSVMEFAKVYSMYTAACSFNKVTLIFNIMTILHAMAGKNRLHIVDYGLYHGFHWASVLRFLATMEGGPLEVKITAIGCPQLRSFPAQWTEETGRRLCMCAHEFGLKSFKFQSITASWETVCIEDLNTEADEVLIVNELYNFSTLMDESIYFDDPSPRDIVLRNIRKMRPDVFIQGVVNCPYGTSFLTRFREVLFYYSAMFDALDTTMPRESQSRLVLEQDIFGPCALNIIACEGRDRMDRSNTYKQWQLRNQRAGLKQLPLDRKIVNAVRSVVKEHHYHKDFVIDEDHQWLLQGWKGRVLYAHSTWVADDTSV